MPFEVGQTIGGYEFIEVLDTSGTGVTYKVRNPLAERFEMLKILSKELQADQERVDRFLREVKIHARLNHPNIAAFYNAMEIEGQLVMTTELVEGTDLGQLLEQGPIPLPRALSYGRQALSALEYAHRNGVVHRNLSPAALIVTSEGGLKVTEFGLAKTANDPRLTQTGMVLGSMHYIAPEQVKGLPDLDARTDVYALSVVLYEAIAGRRPFDSKSQFEVMQAHVQQQPMPPHEIVPDIPPELESALLVGLAKEPSERFQTAHEFDEALARVPVKAEPAAGSEAAAPESWASQVPNPAAVDSTYNPLREASPAPVPAAVGLSGELASAQSQKMPAAQVMASLSASPAAESAQLQSEVPASAVPEPWSRPSAGQKEAEGTGAVDPMIIGLLTFIVVSVVFFIFLVLFEP